MLFPGCVEKYFSAGLNKIDYAPMFKFIEWPENKKVEFAGSKFAIFDAEHAKNAIGIKTDYEVEFVGLKCGKGWIAKKKLILTGRVRMEINSSNVHDPLFQLCSFNIHPALNRGRVTENFFVFQVYLIK